MRQMGVALSGAGVGDEVRDGCGGAAIVSDNNKSNRNKRITIGDGATWKFQNACEIP